MKAETAPLPYKKRVGVEGKPVPMSMNNYISAVRYFEKIMISTRILGSPMKSEPLACLSIYRVSLEGSLEVHMYHHYRKY
jgi:hypothetical protein